MGSNSIPPKTLSDESINRGLVCAHMHFIARTQRSSHSCPRRVNASNKNTLSTHYPRRWNVTTLMVGLKNGYICKNLTQKVVNPRDIAGERKKKKKKKKNMTVCKELWLTGGPGRLSASSGRRGQQPWGCTTTCHGWPGGSGHPHRPCHADDSGTDEQRPQSCARVSGVQNTEFMSWSCMIVCDAPSFSLEHQ